LRVGKATPLVVSDSLFGELWALVRVYRRGSVPEGDAPEGAARVAVVLGAQVLPGGRASGTLRARVRHAARFYAAGEVSLLIPTGGVGKHPPSEAEVMGEMLRRMGIPEGCILSEREARSTRESARLVAAIAKRRGIQSVVVVTDPLHCVRAVEAFRAEGLKARASPVYSSPMWRILRLRRGQFLREIGALLWYRVRKNEVGLRPRP
jgi:uncharacterized SAM-binding protein YcdF (DUF218 family)